MALLLEGINGTDGGHTYTLVCKHFNLGVWHLPCPAFLHRSNIHTSCHSVFPVLCRQVGSSVSLWNVWRLPRCSFSSIPSLSLLFLTGTQLWRVITGHQRASPSTNASPPDHSGFIGRESYIHKYIFCVIYLLYLGCHEITPVSYAPEKFFYSQRAQRPKLKTFSVKQERSGFRILTLRHGWCCIIVLQYIVHTMCTVALKCSFTFNMRLCEK